MKSSKGKKKTKRSQITLIGVFVMLIFLFVAVLVAQERQNQQSKAAPAANLTTNRTNLSFTANGYTSTYHLFAAGLDWTKPVGMILYTDGSGEYGLKNPTSTYLLAGSSGLIAVAKKHNMILITPLSPNKNCSDGDGSCWYLGDTAGYTKWAESLVTSIQSQYPIDKKCIAVGGYSSGAEFSTALWTPSGAAQRTMEDGVIVAISYGSAPWGAVTTFTQSFKANVHMSWNTGVNDPSMSDVKAGYNFYTKAGFQTSLEIIPGMSHNRDDFGAVMDSEINKHIGTTCPGSASPTSTQPTNPPSPSQIVPTFVCGGSNLCVPSGSPTPTPRNTMPIPSAFPSNVRITSAFPTTGVISGIPTQGPNNPIPPRPDGKNNQGFFAILLLLIMKFLAFFASLFR